MNSTEADNARFAGLSSAPFYSDNPRLNEIYNDYQRSAIEQRNAERQTEQSMLGYRVFPSYPISYEAFEKRYQKDKEEREKADAIRRAEREGNRASGQQEYKSSPIVTEPAIPERQSIKPIHILLFAAVMLGVFLLLSYLKYLF